VADSVAKVVSDQFYPFNDRFRRWLKCFFLLVSVRRRNIIDNIITTMVSPMINKVKEKCTVPGQLNHINNNIYARNS